MLVGCLGDYCRAWGIGEVTLPGAQGLLESLFQRLGGGQGDLTRSWWAGKVTSPSALGMLDDYPRAWGGRVR